MSVKGKGKARNALLPFMRVYSIITSHKQISQEKAFDYNKISII